MLRCSESILEKLGSQIVTSAHIPVQEFQDRRRKAAGGRRNVDNAGQPRGKSPGVVSTQRTDGGIRDARVREYCT